MNQLSFSSNHVPSGCKARTPFLPFPIATFKLGPLTAALHKRAAAAEQLA